MDIVKAQSADLVLYNGFNLERWFERFLENVQDVPSVVVTEGIEPMGISDGPYTGKPNPHAWMSPANALIYIENIRKALVEHDPANAATYDRNAAAYAAEIKALDEPLRQRLAAVPEERRWLVTSEGAFSYLARDYGMREAYLWPINADEQGTPKQVRRVIDLVRENGIPVVFSESTISDRAAKQVASETGAAYGGVLYVELAECRGRAGADLHRPAQGDRGDDRPGLRRLSEAAGGEAGVMDIASDLPAPSRAGHRGPGPDGHATATATRRWRGRRSSSAWARSALWSASTAAASRPCSRRSWASCARPAARCCSAACRSPTR